MKLAIFLPPRDFKDESASMIKLFLDKWGVKYDITSYTSKDCIGSHGAVYRPTINTGKVSSSEYGGIILVDGNGVESYKLYDYRPLLDLVMNFNNARKYIVGIDNVVKILARANIIKDRKVATDGKDKEELRLITLFRGIPSENGLEVAGNLITVKDSSMIEESMQAILEHIGVT